MKRYWATFLVTSLLWAGPGHAQFGLDLPTGVAPAEKPKREPAKKPSKGSAPKPAQEARPSQGKEGLPKLLSQFCSFTFFSNGSDTLGAPSESLGNCVDTGSGNDRVVFKADEFLNGAYVYSDEGRSVFQFSNGPFFFFDQESTAQRITAGDQNDIFRFGMDWSQDTKRSEILPETVLEPGGGNDLLFVGGGETELTHPRRVPNIFVYPTGESLTAKMSCGRPFDKYSLDVLFENASEVTNLNIESKGCGVSLRNHAAPTSVEQSGGRTVLEMRPSLPGFLIPLEMDVTNGSAFSGFLVEPGAGVDIDWSGYGLAALRLENFSGSNAGSYAFQSDDTIFAQLNLDGATMDYKARTSDHLEIEIFGSDTSNLNLDLGAHSAHITWEPKTLEMFDITWADEFEQKARWTDEEVEEHSARLVPLKEIEAEIVETVPDSEANVEIEAEADVVSQVPDVDPPEAPVLADTDEGFSEARDDLGRVPEANIALVNGLPLGAALEPGVVSHWDADERLVKTSLQDLVLEIRVSNKLCDSVALLSGESETKGSCSDFLEWTGALDELRIEKNGEALKIDVKDWPISRLMIVPHS